MDKNIISAIINIVKNPKFKLMEHSTTLNRANNMGKALEEYVKDVFANTTEETDNVGRIQKLSDCFSYQGNQNNPPDMMLRNGDAIEVKKIMNGTADLALNSSYPKSKLFSDSSMITAACRNCEPWTEKDIIYVVGVAEKTTLKSLCMIYGSDYAASEETYTRIQNTIKSGIKGISHVELATTKELGRVNRVDPLGITYLRIRGMWGIENPLAVYNYLYNRDISKEFNFMALINLEKYKTFNNTSTLEKMSENITDLNISDVCFKDPNNPSNLLPAKLITFKK